MSRIPLDQHPRYSAPSAASVEAVTSATPVAEQTPVSSYETPVEPIELLPPYHEMSLDSLREVYRSDSENDKGIGGVLDAIAGNIEDRENKEYWTYEQQIVDFARSEAVRLHENRVLKNVDFSQGDDRLGVLRDYSVHINSSDVAASNARSTAHSAEINDFIERHESDGVQSDKERQETVVAYYQIGKEVADIIDAGDKPSQDQVDAQLSARVDVMNMTTAIDGEHARYPQTAQNLGELAAMLEKAGPRRDDTIEEDDEWHDTLLSQLADARAALADIHAKRQKRAFGFDRFNPKAVGNKSIVAQKAQRAYDHAVRELIKYEIQSSAEDSEVFANDTVALDAYIANRTVDEAMALDKQIIEKYSQNKSRLGKVINFLAGRDENGEKDPRKVRMFVRMSVLGVVGAGLAAGTVASGGALGWALASGAVTTGKLYANFEARGRHNRVKKGANGLRLNRMDVLESLQRQGSDLEVYDPKLDAYRLATFDDHLDAKSKLSTQLVEKAANKETNRQKRHVTKRLVGAVAIGVGIGTLSHAFGHGINGQDAHSFAPNGDHPGGAPYGDIPGGTPEIGPGDAPGSVPDIQAPTPEFSPDTFYAQRGDGFYDILQNMGVDAAHRDDVLARASNELFNKGLAYKMENGLPGIPRPGYLSQSTIDVLMRAAGK